MNSFPNSSKVVKYRILQKVNTRFEWQCYWTDCGLLEIHFTNLSNDFDRSTRKVLFKKQLTKQNISNQLQRVVESKTSNKLFPLSFNKKTILSRCSISIQFHHHHHHHHHHTLLKIVIVYEIIIQCKCWKMWEKQKHKNKQNKENETLLKLLCEK
jgi:hypothetical protein